MNELRKAAERLLEALEDGWVQRDDWVAFELRQAIDQTKNQMPTTLCGPNLEEILNAAGFYRLSEQKPKAWIYDGNLHIFDPTDWALEPESVQPLYPAPVSKPWVSLTDEEIAEIQYSTGTQVEYELFDEGEYGTEINIYPAKFARAIEAKLKEKNT